MGRKALGPAARTWQVNIRLNESERAELERKRILRGLDASSYFRALMKEDSDDQS